MPAGYTFTPVGSPIHDTALERFEKLLEKAGKRDPDQYDMYIYNGALLPINSRRLFFKTEAFVVDFFGYAILDLVDESLSSIHTLVTKKRWVESWHALTALTLFVDTYSDWISTS